ncbi:efflux RND transporter periplasmic adaptor subunit [Tabrizicola sp.]|uniref:efflux RND transporter periplasmic adaptor subunit n=1 Tax=Tabrizicola sp. TaxID=2005166 RepID=UPI001A644648|nr:efflux RND transporter periplasmic adaptor subunit [Tabrizicola sp.]MBL9073243.1 efflux RND transporter periplasmic adaptor subunit [Tabrizicola sp.]
MAKSADDMARILGQGRHPRRRWFWLLLAALALSGGGAWLWLGLRQEAGVVRYETEAVSRGQLVVTVTATGSVQPTTQVDVSSELSGALAEVAVDFNDRVQVGQVLARLDDTKLNDQILTAEAQLQAAEASLEQAEAAVREAQVTYESQAELDKRGQSTRLKMIAVEVARDRALAVVDGAKAEVALARARLSEAKTELGKATIRSPISGVVLNRAAEPGQIVAASLNAPVLFTLAEDLARMELRVDVDEADIGRVAVGNEARFTVDAFPGRSFPAVITTVRYAPETTDGVVTYKAILSVDNGEGLLRPGMTATATIAVTVVEDTLRVPGAALRYEPPQVAQTGSGRGGNGLIGMIMPRRPDAAPKETGGSDTPTVWVLRDGIATEVEVQPGESDGKLTAVASENLSEGDLVILDQSTGS